MNDSVESMDMTAKTINHTMPNCDESSINFNNNIEFSNLEISEIPENEGNNTTQHPVKLSITLETNEMQLLSKMPPANGLSMTMCGSNVAENLAEIDSIIVEESTMMEGEEIDEAEEDEITEATESCTFVAEQTTAQTTAATLDEYTDSYMTDETHTMLPANERHFFQHGCVELGRRLWSSNALVQHYTKGCLWSPDGTCALVPVHLDGMHVIELPTDLYLNDAVDCNRPVSELSSAVHIKEGGTVYDYAWYPFMNSGAPETCCWLATRQHEPIHMWDAFNGELRCTYRGYDDVDEVESAISVIFSNDGEQVIGGYKKNIKVFDTNIPGRSCSTVPVKQAVSCFALSGSNDSTITAGSWNGYINHYDLRVPKLGALFTLGGHKGGITWLRYAPNGDNWLLYSGARKDDKILQWDMRNYTQPVREFKRNVRTNQRIYFDLSAKHEWLISGDTEGLLRIWDLCADVEQPPLELQLHQDCCNGVNFHPSRPIVASSAGQYHFANVTGDEGAAAVAPERLQDKERLVDYENSLLFLWFGKSQEMEEDNEMKDETRTAL